MLLTLADKLRAHRAGKRGRAPPADLINGRPDLLMFMMAALMGVVAVVLAVTALTGEVALGIYLAGLGGEASSTAMIVAVYALIDRRVDDGQLPAHLRVPAATAASLAKAVVQYGGAQLAAVWVTRTPLPAGWTPIAVQIAVTGVLTVAAATWLWLAPTHGSPRSPRPPAVTRAARAVKAVLRATLAVIGKLRPTRAVPDNGNRNDDRGDSPGLQSSPIGVVAWLTGTVITLGPFLGGVGPWLSLAVVTGLAVGLVWAVVGLVRRVGPGIWARFARTARGVRAIADAIGRGIGSA